MLKILSSLLLSVVFSVGLFAFAKAEVNVTAVPVNVNVVNTNLNTNVATGTCAAVLNNFHKIGSQGDEVKKLQNFLNRVNGAKLNGQGYFGPVTEMEVKNFQFTYGIKPTGYQHVLTTKMINDIECGRVAVKPRKVYKMSSVSVKPNVSMGTNLRTQNQPPANAANNTIKNLVKEYENTKAVKATTTPSLQATTTKATFWENLSNDWNKIKENYKAYLLVFVLVLALFWFLRKAATE